MKYIDLSSFTPTNSFSGNCEVIQKKVLVISDHSDRRIIAELSSLAKASYDVYFLYSPDLKDIPESLDGVTYLTPKIPNKSKSPNDIANFIYKMLIFIYSKSELVRAVTRILFYFRWRRFFKRSAPATLNIDIIHCHDLRTLPVASLLKRCFYKNASIIYDSHEFFPYITQYRWEIFFLHLIQKFYIKEASCIIAVNKMIASMLENIYSIKNTQVIYNGYDLKDDIASISRERFLQHFKIENNYPNVLFQGSITEPRNLKNLVRAASHLHGKANILFLGDGNLKTTLQSLAKMEKLTNVYFGNQVPQTDLLAYTRHAEIGIIPYIYQGRIINNLYATPNKLFEFMAAEVPICATSLPEVKRIIDLYGIGSCFDMGKPQEIANAIEETLSRQKSGYFKKESFRKAMEDFSWETQGRNLCAIYEKLLTK